VDFASSQLITDAGLDNLKGLIQLRILHLEDTLITDARLDNLTGLTQLQMLFLAGTNVTGQGMAKLQRALPNCQIVNYRIDPIRGTTR
jgi:internalin A